MRNKMIKIEKEVQEVSYDVIEMHIKHLQGKVLTLAEATISDKQQLQANKSLIKDNFNDTLTRVFEVFMYNGLVPEEQVPQYTDPLEHK